MGIGNFLPFVGLTSSMLKKGYRSSLEEGVALYLTENKIKFKYEKVKIEWEDIQYRTYTPDFILPNGIIIETKGEFKREQRKKHVCIKKQHPELDIRFVFSNSRTRIYKNAKSNYGDWCVKQGFMYSDRSIPESWLKEKKKDYKLEPIILFKGEKHDH